MKSVASLSLALLCLTRNAWADLIEVDWNGHRGALTVDTLADLEWLDPLLTKDKSYEEVELLLGNGKEFEGFRHATQNEIDTFFRHLGLPFPSKGGVASLFLSMRVNINDATRVISTKDTIIGYYDDGGGSKVGWAAIHPTAVQVDLDRSFVIEHDPGVGNWLVRNSRIDLGTVTPLWHIADSNRDRVFDQHDLITALQADFYLSGKHGASRSTGDWNGDGFFDQLDVVRVLQVGGYETGRSQALTVPEPSTLALLSLGFLTFGWLRRHQRTLPMKSVASVAFAFLVLSLAGQVNSASMTFDFSSGAGPNFSTFNSGDLWTIDTDGPTLRISKPADDGSFEPKSFVSAGIESRFEVAGDFAITVDFTLHDFPNTPGGDELNESIMGVFAESGDFFEVLRFRWGRRGLIEVFAPPGEPFGVNHSILASGRYRITRTGSTLTGSFAPPSSSLFTTLASLNGSADPMTVKLFASQGRNVLGPDRSMTALDISFDNLIIEANQIIPEPSTLVLLAVGFLTIGWWRRRMA